MLSFLYLKWSVLGFVLYPCFQSSAFASSEWLKSGIQRVATGLDLDEEALIWGLNNNFQKIGGGSCSRVRLLWGNVLKPLSSAKLITLTSLSKTTNLKEQAISYKIYFFEGIVILSLLVLAHCKSIGNFNSKRGFVGLKMVLLRATVGLMEESSIAGLVWT
jgi:hypothetical protein